MIFVYGWQSLSPDFSPNLAIIIDDCLGARDLRSHPDQHHARSLLVEPVDPSRSWAQRLIVAAVFNAGFIKRHDPAFVPTSQKLFGSLVGGLVGRLPPCRSDPDRRPLTLGEVILHEYAASGNCYKVRLTAALLGLPLERREYDIMKGETRTPEFLATVNANGRIPVLQVGDRFIPESNAACFYLADGSPLVPADRFGRADMLHWMFWEQYNHEPNVATLRFWIAFVGEANLSDIQRAQIPAKRAAGEAALKLMDEHLAGRDCASSARRSRLADIALFAYTHVAGDGGFRLADYPTGRTGSSRVAASPGFVPMTA